MEYEITEKKDFMPFILMDRLDDEMILQELEGKLPEVLTYHFKQEGQEVWGLSKAGIDEAKAELAKRGEVIRELEAEITTDEKFIYAKVKAGRFVISKDGKEILLDTAYGFKRQPLNLSSGKKNPFAFEQAGIKACRNASFRLIPKSITQAVIEYAKSKGKVKEVVPGEIEEERSRSLKDFEFLKKMQKAKKAFKELTGSEDKYYEILQVYNYEHADQVKEEDKEPIILDMREQYKKLQKEIEGAKNGDSKNQ